MKLILHAGTHKTGTTAIQSFAVHNRKYLLSKGLLYPDYDPLPVNLKDGHHAFGHAFSDTQENRLSLTEARSLAKIWEHEASRENSVILLSVEAVYRHFHGSGNWREKRKAYLSMLSDTLKNFDVEIILVFRRPDDYIMSLYKENVISGPRRLPKFEKWLESSKKNGLHYFENTRIFSEHFPEVRCLIYEDLTQAEGLIENFFKELGFDFQKVSTGDVIRKSLTPAQVVLKNYANSKIATRRQGKEFVEWLKSPDISKQIEECYVSSHYDLWPNHEYREAFLIDRQEDLAALSDTYFHGRRNLFPKLHSGETKPGLPDIPRDLKLLVDSYFVDSQ